MNKTPGLLDRGADIIERKRASFESKKEKELEKKIKANEATFNPASKEARMLITEYKAKRKQAIKEEKLEFYGEENVSVKGRQAFFRVLKIAHSFDEYIPFKDVEIIKNAFYTHPEFVDKDKIRLIVEVASKTGGLDKADEVTSEITSLLRGTKYYDSLLSFRNWISTQKTTQRIKQLKQNGLSSEQIAERLHITTAEVGVYSSAKQMPKLFEEQTR